jgi:outer membrane lipoprotein-sorting protein
VGQPRQPAPPPDPEPEFKADPAWNKLLIVVAIVAVVVAVLVVPGILNRGGKNPVAAAAEATQDVSGVRMNFQMSVSGSESGSMSGSGVMNGETQQALIDLRGSDPSDGRRFTMTEVVDGSDVYIRMPELTQRLGTGQSWVLIRAESLIGDAWSGSGGLGEGMSANPREQLDQLAEVTDDVTEIGHESVGGVATTHYTATIDMEKALGHLRDQSSEAADLVEQTLDQIGAREAVDVWVDGDGLLRRMVATLGMGAAGNFTMTMDFSDYGIRPTINVPPESAVYDATSMIDRMLSGSGAG